MAQHTKHSLSAPPSAPPRESTGHLLLRALVVFDLVVTFGYSGVYYLVGETGAVIVFIAATLATLAVGIPMVATERPQRFAWRRLPWTALGYLLFALLSVTWSHWPHTTLLTWGMLACFTVASLFIAHTLNWHALVASLSSAFKWIVGLSLAIELWAAVIVRGPILSSFVTPPPGDINPQWYWVRANLLEGGRLQGFVGNANSLAFLSLFALIVFVIRFMLRARWRTTHALWALAAAFLLFRASSVTAFLSAGAVAVAVTIAILIRRAQTPGARTRVYAASTTIVLVGGATLWFAKDAIFSLLGRSADLTGRSSLIWGEVLGYAWQSPVIGMGFASPWVTADPDFAIRITDHTMLVTHSHSMWIDVFMQLGGVGVLLMAIAYGSLLWRAWFFAVDRPRWDLRANRPYSPLTFVPLAFTIALLVQGLVESTPIMMWGWMLLVLLTFKIKSVPIVGVGLTERSGFAEFGRRARRVP